MEESIDIYQAIWKFAVSFSILLHVIAEQIVAIWKSDQALIEKELQNCRKNQRITLDELVKRNPKISRANILVNKLSAKSLIDLLERMTYQRYATPPKSPSVIMEKIITEIFTELRNINDLRNDLLHWWIVQDDINPQNGHVFRLHYTDAARTILAEKQFSWVDLDVETEKIQHYWTNLVPIQIGLEKWYTLEESFIWKWDKLIVNTTKFSTEDFKWKIYNC